MSRLGWRFLRESPLDGSANMARDEALLMSAASGAPPALRLYAWARPTLSLGVHQSAGDVSLKDCRESGVDLVRRPTGGGAVLHDAEVTYSVTGRIGEDPFPRSVGDLYARIAAALIEGLSRLGVAADSCRRGSRRAPADCFGAVSAREIVAEGRKLVGSAQLRRRGVFLQHGSILIDLDVDRLGAVLGTAKEGVASHPGGESGRTASHPTAITLGELLRRQVPRKDVEDAIAEGFRAAFTADLAPCTLTVEEAEHAARLRAFKYLDGCWTLEGKVRPGRS